MLAPERLLAIATLDVPVIDIEHLPVSMMVCLVRNRQTRGTIGRDQEYNRRGYRNNDGLPGMENDLPFGKAVIIQLFMPVSDSAFGQVVR